jgi:hypothetical protein
VGAQAELAEQAAAVARFEASVVADLQIKGDFGGERTERGDERRVDDRSVDDDRTLVLGDRLHVQHDVDVVGGPLAWHRSSTARTASDRPFSSSYVA